MESLSLVTLLANIAGPASQRFGALTDIVRSIQVEQEITTIIIFGGQEEMAPYVGTLPEIPRVLITETYWDANLGQSINFNNQIVFIAVSALYNQAMMHQLNSAFGNTQGFTRGFFIVPRYVVRPLQNLEEHFKWCWQSGFANAMVLVEKAKGERWPFAIYRYQRFPSLQIIPADPSKRFVFHKKTVDLGGYLIRSPAFFDPPRVFRIFDPVHKKSVFRGYASTMFESMIKHMNGSVQVLHNQQNIHRVVQQLLQGELDIAMNAYMPYKGVQLSYPIKMLRWCVAVPASREIDVFEYFLRPYQPCTWWACVGCLIYLTFLDAWSFGSLVRRGRLDFGRAALEMLRLLLFLPIPIVRCNVMGSYRVVCFMQAVILGFILSTMYTATLTSLLASTLYEAQLNTLNDVVKHNLKIHVTRHEMKTLLDSSTYPVDFPQLLVASDQLNVTSDLIGLRNEHSYCAHEDLLSFALEQQTDLKLSKIHVVSECLTTVPIGFLMRRNSQFELVVNAFILRSADVGLTIAWARQARIDARRQGLLQMRRPLVSSSLEHRALSLDHMQFAGILLGAGLCLALISFVIENLKRLTRRVRFFIIYT